MGTPAKQIPKPVFDRPRMGYMGRLNWRPEAYEAHMLLLTYPKPIMDEIQGVARARRA
jgi:hypothetical protein